MVAFGSLRLIVPKRSPATYAQPLTAFTSSTRLTVGAIRLSVGRAGSLMSTMAILSLVPLLLHGYVATTRVLPSTLTVRGANCVSLVQVEAGICVGTGVADDRCPTVTGVLSNGKRWLSFALIWIVSLALPCTPTANEPLGAAVAEKVVPVLALIAVTMIGWSMSLTAPAVPTTAAPVAEG